MVYLPRNRPPTALQLPPKLLHQHYHPILPLGVALRPSWRARHDGHPITSLSSSTPSSPPIGPAHPWNLSGSPSGHLHPKAPEALTKLAFGSRAVYSNLATSSIASSLELQRRRSCPSNPSAKIIRSYRSDDDGLWVQFESGCASKFHHIWLRDNCRCENCFHPHTRQRLLDTLQIPLDTKPTRVRLEDEGFSLDWPDGHKTFIGFSFLSKYSYDPPINSPKHLAHQYRTKRVLWDSTIMNCMPSVSYKDIFSVDEQTWKGDFYVLDWLRKIDKFGFCLVDHVPPTPEDTEKLLRRIAFIRETHYGAFWDFTADMKHGDTAYTTLALGAHTDTTYFSDPAGLQMFHLLSPPTSHEGGKSLLVDGFAAANKLKREYPEAYKVLSEIPIDTHASGGTGVAFRPLSPQPVFSHHPCTGELTLIRWNPDDRKPITGRSGQEVKELYHAIREWQKIIRSQEMELWTQMKIGQALIFDNHRVLHGRSSFTGSRRLCGGYINRDDYQSRLASLERRLLTCSSPS